MNERIVTESVSNCIVCGYKGKLLYAGLRDRLFSAPGTWSLMCCPKCGLVWLNPQPIPEDIGKFYEIYFTHNIDDSVPKFAQLRRLILNSILATHMGYGSLADGLALKVIGHVLSWIGPIRRRVERWVMYLYNRDKGKLLDVGCGSGRFLARLHELGWEVVGVEPDGEAAKLAREYFRLNVHEGKLEDVCFPDNEFDVITMNHVIEHLSNPIGTLKECWRILKPGGKLMIATPNIASLGHRLYKKAWRDLDPPRHLYLFSPQTFSTCVAQAGLNVVKLHTTTRGVRWIWEASKFIQRNGEFPDKSPKKQGMWLHLKGLAFGVIEYGLNCIWPIGEELMLIATKGVHILR